MSIHIKLYGIIVNNQEKALDFYTQKLGFHLQQDIPMGEYRWLSVSDKKNPPNIQLSLEPNALEAAKTFQLALYESGIAASAFEVDDIDHEYQRLNQIGVTFKHPPTDAGPVKITLLDDTCGNWIQLYQTS